MMKIDYMTPEDYEELVEALRTCRQPLPLDDDQIRALAQRARVREVLRGETVLKQGEEPDELYFVISGQLRAADTSGDQPNLLNFHAAKTFVGEQGMLYNQPRAATVDAISDAKLAAWDRSAFDWLLGQDDRCWSYFEDLYRHRARRARRPFHGKQWDEVTLVRTGKHIMMLIAALFGPVFLFLFSLGVLIFALVFDSNLPILTAAAVGAPLLFSLVWGVFNYINWRDDEYIVTSKRVIHIERFVIYGEKRDEAPLIRIQDVTVAATNFWERVLDFYDLSIKTAGAGTIVFSGMRDAERTMEIIFEERAKALERREAADVAHIRKSLANRMHRTVGDVTLPVDTLEPTSGYYAERKRRRLPPLINYLWPRMWVAEGDTITWRKHWFIWLKKTWLALLVFLALLILMILALLGWPPFDAFEGSSLALGLVLVLATVAAFLWYIYLYDDWHRDVYIVTKDRIVDVQSSSFRLQGEERREGTFDVVQNITYVVPGFFNNLLNLGSVTIETAGTAETFTFDEVFNPSLVQQEIVNRMVAFQEERRRQERIREDTKLAEWFGEYQYLHMGGDHSPDQATS
jgi:uncharacterized membrane protein YdbT with pleckstrin-like domain